jgi:hypothetical protein
MRGYPCGPAKSNYLFLPSSLKISTDDENGV